MGNILGGIWTGLAGNFLSWTVVQGYIRSGLLAAAGALGLDGYVGHDGTLQIVGAILAIVGVVWSTASNNAKKKALDVVKAVDASPVVTVVPAHANATGKPLVKPTGL
jgi:hypothetical protein